MSAARRIAKSSVDWKAFFELCPPKNIDMARALKTRSDGYVGRVNMWSAELQAVDFTKYKQAGVSAQIVDNFERAYKAVEVPFPKDVESMKEQISRDEKADLEASKQAVADLDELKKTCIAYLEAESKVPPLHDMTREMYIDYFPEAKHKIEDPLLNFGNEPEPRFPDNYKFPTLPVVKQQAAGRVKDWFDWYLLKGKYAGDYYKANPDESEAPKKIVEKH